MVNLIRFILANALLLLLAAILHIQQLGFLDCASDHLCHEMKLGADFSLTILGVLMLLGFFRCYRSDWHKFDLLFLGIVAAATLFAVKSYLSEPSLERYTSSILIYAEIAAAVGVLLSLASLILTPWLIFRKRWRDLGKLLVALLIAVLCLAVALYVDAPTLIYAT